MPTSPELLLPAGNFEKLRFALAFGADAVYAGVPAYSLRARENQFNPKFLKEAVEYCRDRGKKIYFTANIFPHNVKIPHFLRAMEKMVALEPDAFIMADPGLIHLTREKFPTTKIHLSVQANNVNWASARFWHNQGVERIILSRELSLPEIREIKKQNPDLDIECFVHGAICMAYSGRCLLSNYFTYRDANQGTCAHSCRWEYMLYEGKENTAEETEAYRPLQGKFFLEETERKGEMLKIDEDSYGTYIMSSRDLCLLEYLPQLLKAGVMSLKVEGRSKTIYYATLIARAYRMALNAIRKKQFTSECVRELLNEVFSTSNRGFIPGFLIGNPKEKAQEYEERNGYQTHVFAGVVRSRKGNTIELEVRNRLNKGDTLEFCFPQKKDDFVLTLQEFRDTDGEIRDNFSGGAGNIFLQISDTQKKIFQKNFKRGEEIFCIVRKKVKISKKPKILKPKKFGSRKKWFL